MGAPTYRKLIDHEDISITVKDGTNPTPLSCALVMEQASLSLSGFQQGGIAQAVVPNTRRGKVQSLHRGERVYITGSLTGGIQSVDGAELHNILLKRATYTAAASTLGTGQKVYTVDMEVTVLETQWGGTNEVIILNDVHGTLDISEQDNGPAQVTYNFTAYGEVTVTGAEVMHTERA